MRKLPILLLFLVVFMLIFNACFFTKYTPSSTPILNAGISETETYGIYANWTDVGEFTPWVVTSGTPDTFSDTGSELYVYESSGATICQRDVSDTATTSVRHYAVYMRAKLVGNPGYPIFVYASLKMVYTDASYDALFSEFQIDYDNTAWYNLTLDSDKTIDYIELKLDEYGAGAGYYVKVWIYDEVVSGIVPTVENVSLNPSQPVVGNLATIGCDVTGSQTLFKSIYVNLIYVDTNHGTIVYLQQDWTAPEHYYVNVYFNRTGNYRLYITIDTPWDDLSVDSSLYGFHVYADTDLIYPAEAKLTLWEPTGTAIPTNLKVFVGDSEAYELYYPQIGKDLTWRAYASNSSTRSISLCEADDYKIVMNAVKNGIKASIAPTALGYPNIEYYDCFVFDIRVKNFWSIDYTVLLGINSFEADYAITVSPGYVGEWVQYVVPFRMFNWRNYSAALTQIIFWGSFKAEIKNIFVAHYNNVTTIIQDGSNYTTAYETDNSTYLHSQAAITSNYLINSSGSVDYTGLFGYWSLNESSGTNAKDSAGLNNNGTLQNMAGSEWESGRYGNALHFDGADDRVDLADTQSFSSDEGTIMLWMKPDVNVYVFPVNKWLLGRNLVGNYAGDFGFQFLNSQNDKLDFYLQDGTITRDCFSDSNNFEEGQWYFIAGTWNSTKTVLYIDAIAQADTDGGISLPAHGYRHAAIAQGNDLGYTGESWDGLIDDVRVYSRDLTAEQIQQIYDEFYDLYKCNYTVSKCFTEPPLLANISLSVDADTLGSFANSSTSLYNFSSAQFVNISAIDNYTCNFTQYFFNSTNHVILSFVAYANKAFNITVSANLTIYGYKYNKTCEIAANLSLSNSYDEGVFYYSFDPPTNSLIELQFWNGSTWLLHSSYNNSVNDTVSFTIANISFYSRARFRFIYIDAYLNDLNVTANVTRLFFIADYDYRLISDANRQASDFIIFNAPVQTICLTDYYGNIIYKQQHNRSAEGYFIDIMLNLVTVYFANYAPDTTVTYSVRNRGLEINVTVPYGVIIPLTLFSDDYIVVLWDDENKTTVNVWDVVISRVKNRFFAYNLTVPVSAPEINFFEKYWVYFTIPLAVLAITLVVRHYTNKIRTPQKKRKRAKVASPPLIPKKKKKYTI
ncbi:MAG: LamG domain-containing protein [Candidatus Helarchaeota archaeon]